MDERHCKTCACGCTCGFGGEHVEDNPRCALTAKSGNDVCEHQNANYLRMMSERDELRDAVRELDAVMHHHAERADVAEAEVERLRAVAGRALVDRDAYWAELDEARQQLADLRAGIEALLPGETVNVYAGGGNLVSQRRVVDPDHLRALLAESGEQPGERARCSECGPGYRVGDEGCRHRPAPVTPDSADVREDGDGLLPIEQSLASALWARWADRGGIPCVTIQEDPRTVARALRPWLLAVVGEGVTAEPGKWWRVIAPDGSLWCETSIEREARAAMRPGDSLLREWVYPGRNEYREEEGS